ncbi:MAG: hypothetical protein KatS3mg113_1061 [Planctomycetaceae bacterium]|nr:MAG: hypothetical protein KatS3mg113_1061 [Planctomycetaceae bacterium]
MHRWVWEVGMHREGVLTRRAWLHDLTRYSVGVIGSTVLLGWRGLLQAQAQELARRSRAMILLWMDGGPSQYDTFNPKPGSKYQGPAESISTAIPGVSFAQYWRKTAQIADRLAIIRSMLTTEAEHDRAITLVRTGYPPNPVLRYPTFGSLVARDREDPRFAFPAFVRIGKPRIKTRDVDAGVLGVKYNPFKIDTPGELPPNVRPLVSQDTLHRRLEWVAQWDRQFAQKGYASAVQDKQVVYEQATRFMLSPRLSVFSLDDEPASLREAYGRTSFGQGCLLARRLVESGVSFVEVISTGERNDAGWDTHNHGFRDHPPLCEECDAAFSTLILDLEQRGLLDSTLVVWMGEFGRTPKIKPDGGRDHYAKGWPVVLAGCGIRGGQVLGATDADGLDVTDQPISVPDLCRSFCQALGMNPDEEYITSDGRPIRLVDGGQIISELWS